MLFHLLQMGFDDGSAANALEKLTSYKKTIFKFDDKFGSAHAYIEDVIYHL